MNNKDSGVEGVAKALPRPTPVDGVERVAQDQTPVDTVGDWVVKHDKTAEATEKKKDNDLQREIKRHNHYFELTLKGVILVALILLAVYVISLLIDPTTSPEAKQVAAATLATLVSGAIGFVLGRQ